MGLVLAAIAVIMILTCLATSLALVALWRRNSFRRMETALSQLQMELARTNSLLEHAKSVIMNAGAEFNPPSHPDFSSVPKQAELKSLE